MRMAQGGEVYGFAVDEHQNSMEDTKPHHLTWGTGARESVRRKEAVKGEGIERKGNRRFL